MFLGVGIVVTAFLLPFSVYVSGSYHAISIKPGNVEDSLRRNGQTGNANHTKGSKQHFIKLHITNTDVKSSSKKLEVRSWR
ncbi:MAG: hypothetical protein ACR2G5_16205 [Pyrinomonadaceae bacterium]